MTKHYKLVYLGSFDLSKISYSKIINIISEEISYYVKRTNVYNKRIFKLSFKHEDDLLSIILIYPFIWMEDLDKLKMLHYYYGEIEIEFFLEEVVISD